MGGEADVWQILDLIEGVIGVSCSTGYTNANGVYLITTLKNVPICPYFLQEKGITFN